MRSLKLICAAVALSIAPLQVGASTILGEFWDATSNVLNLNHADAIIAASEADARFSVSTLDYPNNGDRTRSRTTLDAFLGLDAASLTGEQGTRLERSVFRFTGLLNLSAGDQLFRVSSDDGFRLTIDGTVVAQHFGRRGFRSTEVTTDAGEGLVNFELIFFEHTGATGVRFSIDNEVVSPVAVPLPASGALLLVGALVLVTRRNGA